MFLLNKNKTFYTINQMSKEEWLEANDYKLPEDAAVILDDNDELAKKIQEAPNFEIIYKNKKFSGVKELPSKERVPTSEELIENYLNTLKSRDYKLLKIAESMAKFFQEKYPDLELPYNIYELSNENTELRNKVNEEEEKIAEQQESYLE